LGRILSREVLIWPRNGTAVPLRGQISSRWDYLTEKCPPNQLFWGELVRALWSLRSEGHEELVGVDVLEFEHKLLGGVTQRRCA